MAFDIGEFFRRIFTPPGTGGLEAQTQMGVALARAQADERLRALPRLALCWSPHGVGVAKPAVH
jgi:hypothetical protein